MKITKKTSKQVEQVKLVRTQTRMSEFLHIHEVSVAKFHKHIEILEAGAIQLHSTYEINMKFFIKSCNLCGKSLEKIPKMHPRMFQ